MSSSTGSDVRVGEDYSDGELASDLVDREAIDEDDEDEEEEEEQDGDENLQGFIVDEPPESENEDDEDEEEEDDEPPVLDEDDLDLIAENMGMRPVTTAAQEEVPKFRRLKKLVRLEEDEADDAFDAGAARSRDTTALFADDEDEQGAVDGGYRRRSKGYGEADAEDVNQEEWAVDDEEAFGQETYGIHPETVALIAEVFGDVNAVMEMLGRRRAREDVVDEDVELSRPSGAAGAAAAGTGAVVSAAVSTGYPGLAGRGFLSGNKRPMGHEPEEAAREYLTDTDAAIRRANKPERHAVRYKTRKSVYSEEELKMEATWIAWRVTTDMRLDTITVDRDGLQRLYQEAFGPKSSYYDSRTTSVRDDVAEKTATFLHLLLNEHLEVPTILLLHGHRLCPPITERLAWLIVDLDQEWSRLVEAARCVGVLVDQLPESDPDLPCLRSRVDAFKTEQDIDDVRHYINFCYADVALADPARRGRRQAASSMGTSLSHLQKFGIDQQWRPHLLPAHQFATNIMKSETFSKLVATRSTQGGTDLDIEHVPPPEPPLPGRGPEALDAWLSSFTTGPFSTASRVLEALLSLESRQLAVNVRVREALRSWFYSVAQLTTVLTPAGEGVIGLGKRNWAGMNLRRKPVDELLRAEMPPLPTRPSSHELLRQQLEHRERATREMTVFLDIMHAESLGHVTVVIHPLAPNESAPWRGIGDQLRPAQPTSAALGTLQRSGTPHTKQLPGGAGPLLASTETFDATDANTLETLLNTLAGLYVLSTSSTWATEVQIKILQRLVFRELLPLFRKELRYKLQRRAEACVAALCYDALKWRLDMQPYRRPDGKPFRDRDPDDDASSLDDSDSDSDSSDDDSSDDSDADSQGGAVGVAPRVCGMVIQRIGGGVRVHAVKVDRSGLPLQHRRYDRLLTVERGGRRSVSLSSRDSEAARAALRQFLSPATTELVVIGASDLLARDLHRCVMELRNRLKLKRRFQVVYGSMEVPRLYAASELCPKEYKKAYGLEACQAICLAHIVQDPLAAHLQLWSEHASSPNLLLHLKYHPLQGCLLRERLETALLQAAVTTVASVGVDINAIRKHPHLQAPLQFVPGLGPRKAADLLSRITAPVFSRASLMKLRLPRFYTAASGGAGDPDIDEDSDEEDERKSTDAQTSEGNPPTALVMKASFRGSREPSLGSLVYHNCASFLRLGRDICLDLDASDPLACTRAHPTESYSTAQKTARDALEDVKRSTSAEECVVRVIQSPRCLDELDLEEYSYILHSKGQARMLPHLEMIKRELENPYADPRYPFEEPAGERLFYLLIQENPYDFLPGCEVTADVVESRPNGVVRLVLPPSGIPGDPADLHLYLAQEDHYADKQARGYTGRSSRGFVTADVALPVGSVVSCRIKAIDYAAFTVSVVLSEAGAATLLAETLPLQNPGLVPPHLTPKDLREVLQQRSGDTRRRQRVCEQPSSRHIQQTPAGKPKRIVVRRRIEHPRFRLLVPSRAIYELRSGRVGDVLFTPNENVCTELVLIMKVCQTPFMAKTVLIKEFDQKSPGELGRTLKIGRESFVDLDQILGQYVEALRVNLNEVYTFEKFRMGSSLESIEADLVADQEKKATATGSYSIEWGITIDQKHPVHSPGVRFHLMAVPPPPTSADRRKAGGSSTSPVILKDGIYVTPEGFKLWNHKEPSLRRLVNWWKTEGYFHRNQLIAAYNAVKRKHLQQQQQQLDVKNKVDVNRHRAVAHQLMESRPLVTTSVPFGI